MILESSYDGVWTNFLDERYSFMISKLAKIVRSQSNGDWVKTNVLEKVYPYIFSGLENDGDTDFFQLH